MGPIPFQRKKEYWMLIKRGRSTKRAYMTKAGRTKSQPMIFSSRAALGKAAGRESVEATERLSDVFIVIST